MGMRINAQDDHDKSAAASSTILKACIDNVEKTLGSIFSDYVSFGDGSFTITRGSASVMVVVRPFSDTDCVVECVSNVVMEADITAEVMMFLLRKNAELHFGAFGVLFDNTITFSYTILAAHQLTSDELQTTIKAVAAVVDHYDDAIIELSGGKRAIDLNIIDLED